LWKGSPSGTEVISSPVRASRICSDGGTQASSSMPALRPTRSSARNTFGPVPPELDAGAQFLELHRLLEHAHREALVGQRIGRDQPADAAAGDEERQVVSVGRGHEVPPGFS
jgi:hypothetical protein